MLAKIAEAASCCVDFIQLREKDLCSRDLETLADQAADIVHKLRTGNRELRTKLLVNSRTDIALACGADGVHLPANDISPVEARTIWKKWESGWCGAGAPARENLASAPTISVACHSPSDVLRAAEEAADFAIFAPVFEKKDAPHTNPAGLPALAEACLPKIPVLALGGVTLENAAACLQAGATGIAGIRLFQNGDLQKTIQQLLSLSKRE